ncbi:UNVERIFIED_CONTAM: hypothetical protein GTU68_022720 [Idotea baltica]|nr:hypothetical protein [Idotea baltica]
MVSLKLFQDIQEVLQKTLLTKQVTQVKQVMPKLLRLFTTQRQ